MLDPASGVKKLGNVITKKKFGLRTILAVLLVSVLFIPAASAETLTEKTTDKAVEEFISIFRIKTYAVELKNQYA